MNNKKIKELEMELKKTKDEILNTEENLFQLNELMEKTKNDIDLNLDNLESLRNKEKIIKNNIFESRKSIINNALRIDGFKKFLNNPNQLIDETKSKITNSIYKMKEYIDGSGDEKKWLLKNYNDYKKYCIENGLKFKTINQFNSIIAPLRKNIDKKASIKDFYVYLNDDLKDNDISNKASEAIKLIDNEDKNN